MSAFGVPSRSPTAYEFGRYRLDCAQRVLLQGEEPVALTPKAFDVLLALVSRRGQIVERDELMRTVWPDTFVEESSLTFQVSTLRKILGEGLIETIPKRGYRFVAAVAEIRPSSALPVMVPKPKPEPRPRWIVPAIALLAVCAALAIWMALRPQLPKATSVAVLPFKMLDSSDSPLGAALADALITRFGHSAAVVVRPTQAVQRFGRTGQDPIEAGRQLKVDVVVDGSLQRVGDRLRLNVQLIRVADGKQLWGQSFDHSSADLFVLEDSLSAQVAQALTVRLGGNARGTVDQEAHRLYLLGRHHALKRTVAASRIAVDLLQQAIVRDPSYAQPHAILANAFWNIAYWGGGSPREFLSKAKAAAQEAIRLDASMPAGHAWLSYSQLALDHDFKASEQAWHRALELGPDDVDALDAKGFNCLITGRFDESQQARARLVDLNPVDPFSYVARSWALYYSGRNEEAVGWAEKALEVDPNFAMAHNDLYIVKRIMSRFDEAISSWVKQRTLTGMNPTAIAAAKAVFDSGGIRAFDQWNLDRSLERIKAGQYVSPLALAMQYNAIGDPERSIDYLEKADEERIVQVLLIKTFPPWKSLHYHPRFQALMRRIGL